MIYSNQPKPSAKSESRVLRLKTYSFTLRSTPGKRIRMKHCLDWHWQRKDLCRPEEMSRKNTLDSKRRTRFPHPKDTERESPMPGARGTWTLREKVCAGKSWNSHPRAPQGFAKMKRGLCRKVWWPGVDGDARVGRSSTAPEPRSSFQAGPWEELSWSNGTTTVERWHYCAWFRCCKISKGLPTYVRTFTRNVSYLCTVIFVTLDEGANLDYLAEEGILQSKATPLRPHVNGEVGRQNGTILRASRIAQTNQSDGEKCYNVWNRFRVINWKLFVFE